MTRGRPAPGLAAAVAAACAVGALLALPGCERAIDAAEMDADAFIRDMGKQD